MANDDDKSSITEILMILTCSVPVLGAMVSAPIVGSGLASLAVGDSLWMLLIGK